MDVIEVDVGSGAVQDHPAVRGVHAGVGADRQNGLGQLGRQSDQDQERQGERDRHAPDHREALSPRASRQFSTV